jgi:hypothetical protein
MSFDASTTNNSLITFDDNSRISLIYVPRKSIDSVEQNIVPKRLKRTCCCSIALFISGILLLAVGIEESVRGENFDDGFAFFILSFLVFIPGGFYVFQFCRAKLSKNVEERREILDNIPTL